MLAEIYCEKFLNESKQRAPIRFGTSLNVVLGSSNGSNSIGKSTFLLIVDFAFGGNTYSNNKTTMQNVGPHSICFMFHFKENNYFSRSPMDPNHVWRCDENYQKIDVMPLVEFTKWLSQQYGLNECGGTFRWLTSNFMRIYGKDNYGETKPLSAHPQERQEDGVKRLLCLFGEYSAINKVQNALDDANKAKKTYSDSLKRNFIASAHSKAEVRKNEKHIEELTGQISELERMEPNNLSDLDPVVAESVSNLKTRLTTLRRKRALLLSQSKAIEIDADLEHFNATKDFNKLLAFFPKANLKALEDIELFHKGVTKNLAQERAIQKEQINAEISTIDTEIISVEAKIKTAGFASNLTKAVLRRYSDTSKQIDKLREANDSFKKKSKLTEVATQLKTDRNQLIETALSCVQIKMNDSLAQLNEKVCGQNVNTPRLSLTSPSSYSFGIDNDTGTGSQTRALALFDLSVLNLTPLPAIALDTVSIKQVGDDPWLEILDLYSKGTKQVFIAFDKAESYSDGVIPSVIENHTVLELSQGHELFGSSWAYKKE